jgi:cyclin B
LGGGVLGEITNVVHGSVLPTAQSSDSFEKAFVVPMPPHEPGPSPPLPSAGPALIMSHQDYFEVDAQHANDPQQVVEYMFDIFRVLHREEELHVASPGYLERQPSVNEKMRGILVDWLVSVQLKYKLKAETLFLAISLLDRYLELRITGRKQLQLVGVTAMLIAAKFEEMYPPQINDFVYVTDKAYAREDIINMEVAMLTALEFKICRPTSVNFLERYQCINGCTDAHRDLAQYLLELALVDYNMLKYTPSRLAAAAILLSNKLLRRQPSWKPAAVKHTRFTEQMLKECAKEMCTLLEHAQQSPLQAVRKKFAQLKYHSVSKINFGGVPNHTIPNEEARHAARRTIGGASGPRRSVGGGGACDPQTFAPRQCTSPTALSARPSYSARDSRDYCPAPIDTIVSLS